MFFETPATRNRTRDHLIAAAIYSQMLCQLSYSRIVFHNLIKNRTFWGVPPPCDPRTRHCLPNLHALPEDGTPAGLGEGTFSPRRVVELALL